MLFSGFAMTRLTKLARLPNVTGYILAGILIGPYVLNLVPQRIIDGTDFLSDIALAFIAFQTLVVLGVREAPRRDDAEKVTFRKMFTIFMRNDQLVPIGIASLLFNIGNGLLIIFGVNFFYFEFGYADSGDLIFLFTVMYGLGTLFSQALYAFISSRMHRMTILKICMAAIAVGYGMLMGFGYVLPKNVVLLNAIGFIIFFFQGLYNLAVIVMLNNTIEYDELRFGERHDSVISAIRSFSVKLAGAVNQGISALVLIISGIYTVSQNISGLEIEVGKGGMTSAQALEKANAFTAQVQPRQTLLLRIGMVVIPVLALTCAYVLIRKKYKITEEAYQNVMAEQPDQERIHHGNVCRHMYEILDFDTVYRIGLLAVPDQHEILYEIFDDDEDEVLRTYVAQHPDFLIVEFRDYLKMEADLCQDHVTVHAADEEFLKAHPEADASVDESLGEGIRVFRGSHMYDYSI